jgi:predicted AAA+ superfamily ATPase
MIETLKAIILDIHERQLESGVPRRVSLQAVPGKASVCIGVRRSGKSTYLFQIMQRLLDHKVPRQNILYLNLFDDRLHGLQQAGIGLVTEVYYALFPEKKNAETV